MVHNLKQPTGSDSPLPPRRGIGARSTQRGLINPSSELRSNVVQPCVVSIHLKSRVSQLLMCATVITCPYNKRSLEPLIRLKQQEDSPFLLLDQLRWKKQCLPGQKTQSDNFLDSESFWVKTPRYRFLVCLYKRDHWVSWTKATSIAIR